MELCQRDYYEDLSSNPGTDDCGRYVLDLYPTTDPCFQKYLAEDPAIICSATGIVKQENIRYDRFTGADCGCDANSLGNGFYCYYPCTRADERLMACRNELTCQVSPNGTKFCGCVEGTVIRDSIYCQLTADSCQSCRHNCHAASSCISTNDFTRFRCSPCEPSRGYTGDGTTCKDIDECAAGTHSCDKNADCVNLIPLDDDFQKYRCDCRVGFRNDTQAGTSCRPCQDENECERRPGICGENAVCQNSPGSYSCLCQPGFISRNNVCVDIDECVNPIRVCHADAICTNTMGSYTCTCKPGMKGDGVTSCQPDETVCSKCDNSTTSCFLNTVRGEYECQCIQNHHRISETRCAPNTYCDDPTKINCAPRPKSICYDYPDGSGYNCTCAAGYMGNGTYCVETNICERERPCQFVARTVCVPNPNNEELYTCECKPGYVRQLEGIGNSSAPCFESGGYMANNCTVCDTRTEECVDVIHEKVELGSLKTCVCKTGYRRGADEKCRNINECTEGLHDCDPIRARCEDRDPFTHGMTHQCFCLVGYEGSGKKDSCKNINECANTTHPVCRRTGRTHCVDTIGSYLCECEEGYRLNRLTDSCEDIDECSTYLHECRQFSECVNTLGSYQCVCNRGFRQIGVDSSTGHPLCENINQCVEGHLVTKEPVCDALSEDCYPLLGGAECLCKKGFERFSGSRCIDIDECRDSLNNNCDLTTTRCNNLNGTYECVCQDGFEKPVNNPNVRFCDDIDECQRGTYVCHPNSVCRDTVGSYICTCADGFRPQRGSNAAKPHCERDKICETQRSVCIAGVCVDTSTPPYYRCECSVSTVKYNDTTCIDSKYCDSREFTCPVNSQCSGISKCECAPGYRWVDLKLPLTIEIIRSRQCKEIDWCLEVGTTQCRQSKCRSTPHVGPGTGECYCDAGFTMTEGKCEDNNECSNVNICPRNSTCENKIGSYQCNCDPGFAPDASNPQSTITNPDCKDINECYHGTHNCSSYLNTNCVNREGGFDCVCKTGFVIDLNGPRGETPGCVDDNECLHSPPICNTTTATCINYIGNYECVCLPGYRGRGTVDFPCIDINECTEGLHNCTSMGNSDCQNIPGGWSCNCKQGSRLINGVCVDIDECVEQTHTCNGTNEHCQNLAPGFRCDCQQGYTRSSSGRCEDIDECSIVISCPGGLGDLCRNSLGSYECFCATGFRKPQSCINQPTTCRCENINECLEGRAGGAAYCGMNARCLDTEGSAICTCLPQHEGDPYSPDGCKPSSACDPNPCGINMTCVEDAASSSRYRCVCNEGFIHSETVNGCVQNPCSRVRCQGGGPCSYFENFDLRRIDFDCNCPPNTVYNVAEDICMNDDVCNCGQRPYPCTNSSVCSDPTKMVCARSGIRASCSCLEYFVYNNQTNRCDERDYCAITTCDPRATCVNVKENDHNVGAVCVCPTGEIHESGRCIVDAECSQSSFCREDPNSFCVNGTCVCRTGFFRIRPTDLCTLEQPCDEFRRIQGRSPCNATVEIERNNQNPRSCVCDCRAGYRKESDTCVDINECEGVNPCSRNDTHPECVNNPGSYFCACGFSDTRYQIINGRCQIPNPCLNNSITCGANSQCSPQTGRCECLPGYQFDISGEVCENINECLFVHLYSCPENSECFDTVPGYDCRCQRGYKRVNQTNSQHGFVCVDINECDPQEARFVQCPQSPDTCVLDPTFKICPDGSNCRNTPGDYACDCVAPLIQHGLKDCAQNTTTGCAEMCGQNAHCIRLINERNVYNCTCDSGFELGANGSDCIRIDECKRAGVCPENSDCVNLPIGFQCVCREPYKMVQNECVLDDKCTPNLCPVNSICKQLEQPIGDRWITCECTTPGYRFNQDNFTCEDIDECSECTRNSVCPCPDEAIQCRNTQGSYDCTCPAGYEYQRSSNSCVDIDECARGLHSATCPSSVGTCRNTNGSWECVCLTGYTNSSPQQCVSVDLCAAEQDNCDRETTTCRMTYQSPFFTCECLNGYQPDPYNSTRCVDMNECYMGIHTCNPLTEDCINTVPSFHCNCSTGYERINGVCSSSTKCTLTCPEFSQCITHRNGTQSCVCINNYEWVDNNQACSIKGCDSTNCPAHSKCLPFQAANNTDVNRGSLRYRCVCNEPYVMNNVSQLCLPPDDPCASVDCGNGNCIRLNVSPFYACTCPTSNCANVTCNSTSCDVNADCSVVANSTAIQCKCREGYEGSGLSGHCVRENACDKYRLTCSNLAACRELQQPGEYECVCNTGYTGNGTYCYDINECTQNTHNCDVNSECLNTQGSYQCVCKAGYQQVGLNGVCTDIDECAVSSHNCEVTTTSCVNTNGSYYCVCREGFRNNTYPFTSCIDIDECSLNQTLCGIHICINMVPGYRCECREGYQPRGDSNICEDIDECSVGSHLCHRFADCFNTPGSYDCTCREGYQGDGRTNCSIIDLCASEVNRCNNATTTCEMAPDRADYKCVCLPGYQYPVGQSDPHSCEDILECQNVTLYDPISTNCEELPGSYKLECKRGYENTHPNPSDHNVTCTNLDECAMDPAYVLALQALEENPGILVDDLDQILPPPMNNASGYAFCYNQFMAHGYYSGFALLPLCVDEDPDYTFPYASTDEQYPPPVGFGCTCAIGEFTYSENTETITCVAAGCNCNAAAGLTCRDNFCVCADPRAYLRIADSIASCVYEECSDAYPFPPDLARFAHLLTCVDNVLQAIAGYRVVRHEVTQLAISVEDVNECEAVVNPCCTSGNCTGPDCLVCVNTQGSYQCQIITPFSICVNVDKEACKCTAASCPYETSWFYGCEGYSAYLLPALEDQVYNRRFCSRIKLADSPGFMTFETMKDLYRFINTFALENKYMIPCMFPPTDDDLTDTHMFNYWGACTDKIEEVTCEVGQPQHNRNKSQVRCPLKADMMPQSPAIGQPVGQPYPRDPLCYTQQNAYRNGSFYWTTTGLLSFAL